MSELLRVESVTCGYAGHTILENVSFVIAKGDIACLLGPSGCGKTTLLRALAGFNPVLAGQIYMQGQLISSADQHRVPERRQMGMVFQDYALFPHLTVADNIGFGLHCRGSKRRQVIAQMLETVCLPDLSGRYPHELSGGQQQRVALARALASQPRLLLMDEPFSNLDTKMRKSLSLEVRDIIKQQGLAAVVVTHDQEEAFAISDVIGVLTEGQLRQWGSAETLYFQPSCDEVATFVGEGDSYMGQPLADGSVQTELGRLQFSQPLDACSETVTLFIRPADIRLVDSQHGAVQGVVERREFMGESTHYQLRLPSGRALKSVSCQCLPFQEGDTVGIEVTQQQPIILAS